MDRHTLRIGLGIGVPAALAGAFVAALVTCRTSSTSASEPALTAHQATEALHRAVAFFREQVSSEGGYLWRYSADLKFREGEGAAGPTTAWVQPPGTPTVGLAYLEAYQLTGDRKLLQAARETALALVRGQLRSGGWDYRIEFDPQRRRRYAYRVDPEPGRFNVTTLDDDTTQSAIRFLIRIDRELEFRDAAIHEAARFALDSLLRAQYPNGAWPQRFSEFPAADRFPVRRASFPDTWSRTWPSDDYRGHYTFNDGTIADCIETMLDAGEIYNDERYRNAALEAGDFILLAQLPEPQPAWAQQYDADMHPAWARRFEPPAVTGGESQGVLRVLMDLYERTGEKRFLEPIPRALDYLKRSRLPDGRLARFYELKTNRPLYFTKDYRLTYDDSDLPTHYGFKVPARLESLETRYRRLLEQPLGTRLKNATQRARPARSTAALRRRAQEVVEALDERGAWVEQGRLHHHEGVTRIITTQTFVENLGVLARFVGAVQRSQP